MFGFISYYQQEINRQLLKAQNESSYKGLIFNLNKKHGDVKYWRSTCNLCLLQYLAQSQENTDVELWKVGNFLTTC